MFSQIIRRVFLASGLVFCAAGLILSFLSVAQAQTAVPPMPKQLDPLVKEGAQVRYLGDDLGLEGWMVVMRGNQQFFYVTPDKKALLSGVLYAEDGTLVTTRQLQRLGSDDKNLIDQFVGGMKGAPEATAGRSGPQSVDTTAPSESDYANLSPSEQLLLTVEHSNWVALGDENAPVVYSFIDPQCPHCHDFINDLRRGFLKRGMIQLRVVPVGLMNADSLKQAAFLLSAPDAENVFYKHLDGDKDALPINNTFSTDGVELNIDIMRGWGLDVTPFSIYRDAAGKVKILKGLPSRLEELMSDLP
jgi:thiol:disulfide interchange protein DsbG